MMKNNIRLWLYLLIAFMAGCLGTVLAIALQQTVWGVEERRLIEDVNHALSLQMRGDIAFEQSCDGASAKVKQMWPSDANSFHVMIEDHSWGLYECRVFFDTGSVYSVLARHDDGEFKIESFEKLKWPNRRNAETSWNMDQ
jgi:hypothetical protein